MISDHGSPNNYNTQRFESNHKFSVKNVANNVQKRGHGRFMNQIAIWGYEHLLLNIAMDKLLIDPIESKSRKTSTTGLEISQSITNWKTLRTLQYKMILEK